MPGFEVYNTFGIKTYARQFIDYCSEEELIASLPQCNGRKTLHVGGGSNLLFLEDFDGVVLHSKIRSIDIVNEQADSILVKVGAGIVWDDFVDYAVAHHWYGAENLSLIPGEVGASAVQNIGAYGVEVKDLIESVDCISLKDGSRRVFSNAECHYAYRQSIFKHEVKGEYAVTYVTYRLQKTFSPKLDYGNIRSRLADNQEVTASLVRQIIIDIRRQKLPDPSVLGNAGSFFMNPIVSQEVFESIRAQYPEVPHYVVDNGVKIPAGWMIEQCGWKGKSLGRAAVYEKQALILVNLGGATGKEIVDLCEAVRNSVREKFGVDIHPEVNFI